MSNKNYKAIESKELSTSGKKDTLSLIFKQEKF